MAAMVADATMLAVGGHMSDAAAEAEAAAVVVVVAVAVPSVLRAASCLEAAVAARVVQAAAAMAQAVAEETDLRVADGALEACTRRMPCTMGCRTHSKP